MSKAHKDPLLGLGSTDSPRRAELPGRSTHVAKVLERIRDWLEYRNLDGVLLATPGNVAWATGGVSPRIDRCSPLDAVQVAVGPKAHALITTNVEQERLMEETEVSSMGFEVVGVPWYDHDRIEREARSVLSAWGSGLALDRPLSAGCDGVDLSEELVALRLAHTEEAKRWMLDLGADVAADMEEALSSWAPGQVDLHLQARLVGLLERDGVEPVVVLVGGDERVRRFRHPVAVGRRIERLAMVVVVGRRHGLHVAATRFASADSIEPELRRRFEQVMAVEEAVLRACRAGQSYGSVLEVLSHAYQRSGFPDAWREHYQGGPIGFDQREFEIAPGQNATRWYRQPIEVGHAVAWNPSVGGGAKSEGTYLVDAGGLRCLTPPGDWPVAPETSGLAFPRAGVLELS